MGRVRYSVALIAIHFMFLSLTAGWQSASAITLTERVAEELKESMSHPQGEGPSFCRKEVLCGVEVMVRFYGWRAFRPAWMDPEGRFEKAQDLLEAIRTCPLQGLKPDVYHLKTIEALLAEVEGARNAGGSADPEALSDLDLLLTDAFLTYGSHMLSGRVDPETIDPRWVVTSRETDLGALLEVALEENGIDAALEGFLPRHPGYASLRQALLEHKEFMGAGGWPAVPAGPTLHPGERDRHVAALRARLAVSGDLDENDPGDPEHFDCPVEGAVRRFQRRHGLTVDGVVGKATVAALNVSVEERVRQIELNMERWRWLPDDLGRRYILINTADFMLEIVEEGKRVLAMRVVAGRKASRTPVFSGRMTYLVLNPYWHIPHKLAVRDILPQVQKDPSYLQRQGIRVFESWEDLAPEVEPETIDWSGITKHNFSYKLRQDSGPSNALGRVKFMFPNKFAVYLHDTPARHMFRRSRRDFSSGCIRVEKPIDLAEYALRGDPRWTREEILTRIKDGKTRIVWLPEPIPVHVLYWTAWVEEEDVTHFRKDVYERDGPLAKALEEAPLRYQ